MVDSNGEVEEVPVLSPNLHHPPLRVYRFHQCAGLDVCLCMSVFFMVATPRQHTRAGAFS